MRSRCWGVAALAALIFAPIAQAGDAPTVLRSGPYEVRALRDLPYKEGKDVDASKHKLDLFLPKDKTGFPVLFFIHGGGWTIGDRRWFDSIGPVFAKNGVGTVVISYRLSPKVQHPAHIEDVAAAFAWTHRNIAKYGGRPDRIFVSGQSAGGHLTALLATNPKYLQAHGLSPKEIRGEIPISGIYQVGPGFLSRVFGSDPKLLEDASPLKHVEGDEPPTLVMYADRDMPGCAYMSKRFTEALKTKSVPADVVEIKDRSHVSIMLKLMVADTDPTAQEMLKFIAKHSDLELKPVEVKEEKPKP